MMEVLTYLGIYLSGTLAIVWLIAIAFDQLLK
ncbi:hypothetical protein QFZ72_004507 [Bacillus sp. V2I10]|nr:hypothetical protein [Bacillus sp. V2I10]